MLCHIERVVHTTLSQIQWCNFCMEKLNLDFVFVVPTMKKLLLTLGVFLLLLQPFPLLLVLLLLSLLLLLLSY